MARVLAKLDDWFAERGYKGTGTRHREWRKPLDGGDIILKFWDEPQRRSKGIVAGDIGAVVYSTKLGPFEQALREKSSLVPVPTKKEAGAMLYLDQSAVGWPSMYKAEETGDGPLWDEHKKIIGPGIDTLEANLAGNFADHIGDGKYWQYTPGPYAPLLVSLHLGHWDKARDYIQSLTVADYRTRRTEGFDGLWSVAEEIANAQRLVDDYITTHS
ncbi:hypothetical protein [Corynebacterium cystitidis]|uniref:DUF4304 domain-containing protein n=1 Tax=Corynebacterium cystitidis DSM 20524 TaxID=1121357 RepID=A0A1H9WQZ1_9CORY|nr:hypothetical protein [Corynebacterium cystitidis]WJY83703.1 hypothetical protein CCYS_14110 [Corynebacterium cystitidis DSM 20524]SES13162.1 hypothetical protein SAMN05661109_01937 [Corynebacterium cystitidis DSM 20524]SES36356.1 hypothetical protein SAMN05661109_02860 [Corynebacterium cystitidis DSM 20524]SNV91236.1 Uncharacterised protein [Corynebacterium cystitidis]